MRRVAAHHFILLKKVVAAIEYNMVAKRSFADGLTITYNWAKLGAP